MDTLALIRFNGDRTIGQTAFSIIGKMIDKSCIIENSEKKFQYIVDGKEYYHLVTVDKKNGKLDLVEIKPKAFKNMKKFLKS